MTDQFTEQPGPDCVYTTAVATLRVKGWSELYENHRSREIKKLEFVLVPNRMDTDGYTTLLDHPNGAAHLGAWLAILQVASRCKERGVLANTDGRPHDARSLSRISRIPAAILEEVIPRLVYEVQWLEQVEWTARESRAIPREGAGFSREGATPTRVRVTVPFSSVPVEISARGGVGEIHEAAPDTDAAAEKITGTLDELARIYQAGGLPIPEKHRQLVLQYLLGLPGEKLKRLVDYVAWAFATGRWSSPAKTKALLQLIRDGDWDVELAPRTLPDAVQSRPPSKAQEAQNVAAARILQKYGVTA